MIRMVVRKNALETARYFNKDLEVGDYYATGIKSPGLWHGQGAEKLGLTGNKEPGVVTPEQFHSMILNRDPIEGGPLTERTVSNRRIGYDISFHPPKSFSILYGITQDAALLNAFRESVRETMNQMESEMKCRVRKHGMDKDRAAQNLCWAEFVHFTARPVKGKCDPHVHTHAFVFNAVYDELEKQWKAGQFGDLKRDCPFFEASFHSRLTSKLVELGHVIERRGKSWEIAKIPRVEIEQFSLRTAVVEAKAKELGITDPRRKDNLGPVTREKKGISTPWAELQKQWTSRIDPKVKDAILQRTYRGQGRFAENVEQSPESTISLTIAKVFERRSVVTERQFLTAAMKCSLGSVPLPELEKQLQTDSRFIRANIRDQMMVTTKEVMAEEKQMIAFAREGRGTRSPLSSSHEIQDIRLNDQQRAAVTAVLNSTDRVMIVRGGAGTGKTTLMQEAFEGIKKGERKKPPGREHMTVLAPTADASRGVLRAEGFATADTVAKFLIDKKGQSRAQDGVIWVDEAGMLGSRSMAKLFETAKELNARVILSGDIAQHKSVERGEPLKLLTKYAGVEPHSVSKVIRQTGLYKTAVEHMARGDFQKGLGTLQKMGCIHEMDEAKAHKEIAINYANQIERGRSATVICPTHAEGRRLTGTIRDVLKERHILDGKGQHFDRLEDLHLTTAEKGKAYEYEKGRIVKFHQNVTGFQAGKTYAVIKDIPGVGVKLHNGKMLPLDKAECFNVYQWHPEDTEVCRGDKIRITANGKTAGDRNNAEPKKRPHTLNNGAIYTVKGFSKTGDIVLANGWTLPKDYGHFTHAHVSTGPQSQGKTFDAVYLCQSASSFAATSAPQVYVGTARGKTECHVYTDDFEGLKERIEHTSPGRAAVELSRPGKGKSEDECIKVARSEREDFALQWRQLNGPQIQRDRAQLEYAHV